MKTRLTTLRPLTDRQRSRLIRGLIDCLPYDSYLYGTRDLIPSGEEEAALMAALEAWLRQRPGAAQARRLKQQLRLSGRQTWLLCHELGVVAASEHRIDWSDALHGLEKFFPRPSIVPSRGDESQAA